MIDSRVATIKSVSMVVKDGRSLTAAITEVEANLSFDHRPVFRQMSYGLLRHYFSLDEILNLLLAKPLAKKHFDLKCLLLLGIYQLKYMQTPQHACVDEAVKTTRTLGKAWAKGLVNGVLRQYIRQHEALATQLAENNLYKYDHPHWLRKKIQHSWPEQADAIMLENNRQAAMTLRINTHKVSREEYIKALAKQGIASIACQFSPYGISLESAQDITTLPGFVEGHISVQDEASQLAVPLLDLQPEYSVLDACAAPGGKSCHILEAMPGIDLVSIDSDDQRALRIKDNMDRLGVSATIITADALQPEKWWSGEQFDRILLDAPCSATGIIRRHPDIKLLRKESDIDKLASQQTALLESLWPLLKRNGILVYSTCSILIEENYKPIQSFLSRTPDAKELTIDAEWGMAVELGRQLFPVMNAHDGFFYARLCKE